MILLNVNGDDYTDFESVFVSKSIQDLNGEFEFIANYDFSNKIPFKGGEPAQVFVDGLLVITGFIEIINVDYSVGTHTINISGRDKTADIGDSTIGVFDSIDRDINLVDVCKAVISHIGASIEVENNAGFIKRFDKNDSSLVPEFGQNAFDFIQKLCRMRDVLATSNGNGDLVLSKNGDVVYKGILKNTVNDLVGNNIISGSMVLDLTRVYNKYITKVQASTSTFGDIESDTSKVVDKGAPATDDGVRNGRQYAFEAEKSEKTEELQKRANWERDVRRSRAKVSNVTVEGHSTVFGEVYEVNKLIKVKDDFTGINETMLIGSLIYNVDSDTGNTTEIGLINKDSFTDLIEDPSLQTPGNVDDNPFAQVS